MTAIVTTRSDVYITTVLSRNGIIYEENDQHQMLSCTITILSTNRTKAHDRHLKRCEIHNESNDFYKRKGGNLKQKKDKSSLSKKKTKGKIRHSFKMKQRHSFFSPNPTSYFYKKRKHWRIYKAEGNQTSLVQSRPWSKHASPKSPAANIKNRHQSLVRLKSRTTQYSSSRGIQQTADSRYRRKPRPC